MKTKLITLFFALMAAVSINAQETITCAQAKQLMPAQKDAETDVEYIVVGYVTKLSSNPSPSRTDANVMQQRFYMDDVKGSAETVNCYWCNLPEEYKETGLNIGDKISVKGKIINYNDQPELKNAPITMIERAEVNIETFDVSVCEAIEEGSSLNDGATSVDIFRVLGRLKGADAVNNYGQHTFDMACEDNDFKAYLCAGAEGLELGKGDSVMVTGKLYNYNGTIEISNGKVELIEKSTIEVVVVEATVAQAVAAVKALPQGGTSDDIYAVTGYVDSIAIAYSSQYGNVSFFMTDDLSNPTYDFEAYRVKVTEEQAAKVVPGAKVKVTAALKHYYKAATDDQPEIDLAETVEGGTIEYLSCTLDLLCNSEHGFVEGAGVYVPQIQTRITATANYGYHFTQWSDGNTDNPREIELTQDTTFTAEFASNQYTLNLQCDGNQGTVEGAGLFDYLAQVQISATPAYGYHFSSWSDGNTANPRTVSITEDKSYTATFAKNTYTITKIANSEQGSVSGPAQGEYLDNISLTATPEYGYHFAQWNDGNTSNPRTFELTRDTTFTALFALNQYTLSLQCDNNQGTVEGAGVFDYLAEVQISATPAYGYHFSSWSDGNTANPRTYTVTKDVTITANFAPNKYSINVSCNAEQGSVTGSGSYNYLSNRTIEAIPNYGYHFAQWNDGNTDNPRTFELRQDTAFAAIFAVDKYGTCGDNLQLTWRYDTSNQTLTISGDGDLTTNMRYGVEAVKEMKELVIEDGVGVIGNEAFANIKTLNTITLGKDVRKLQERVFYNCYNLTAIYNYRKTPASATSNTFEEVDKYACTIYVLAGSDEMFRSATGWKDFYSILAIGATETTVTDNKASVEPSDNSATVTWPVSNEAASYTIDITKDGVVFCRLTFNANGQLTGIAFAPGRDGQSMAPAALMTANGLQFTVTGLTSNTQYGFSITATDAEDTQVAS